MRAQHADVTSVHVAYKHPAKVSAGLFSSNFAQPQQSTATCSPRVQKFYCLAARVNASECPYYLEAALIASPVEALLLRGCLPRRPVNAEVLFDPKAALCCEIWMQRSTSVPTIRSRVIQ